MYSSLLWLTRKEMKLSSLAQDLVDQDKFSPIVSICDIKSTKLEVYSLVNYKH